jgi:hypothetical protein
MCCCYVLFLTSHFVVIHCIFLPGLTGSVSTHWGTLLLSTFSPYSTSLYHVVSVFVMFVCHIASSAAIQMPSAFYG